MINYLHMEEVKRKYGDDWEKVWIVYLLIQYTVITRKLWIRKTTSWFFKVISFTRHLLSHLLSKNGLFTVTLHTCCVPCLLELFEVITLVWVSSSFFWLSLCFKLFPKLKSCLLSLLNVFFYVPCSYVNPLHH